MFENVGSKIKTLAVVVAWLGIILSFIIGLVTMTINPSTVTFFTGLISMILGSLGSRLSSLGMYAFGLLIENTDNIASSQQAILRRVSAIEDSPIMKMNPPTVSSPSGENSSADDTPGANTSAGSSSTAHKWRCVQCGAMIDTPVCPYCGKGNQL